MEHDNIGAVHYDDIHPVDPYEDFVSEYPVNEVDKYGSHMSSSEVVSMSEDVQSGSSFISDLFLRNYTSGLTASPFLANIETLQKSVGLHGVTAYGLSIEEYRTILFRHIFSGACVQGADYVDRTACHHFAQGFSSSREMTRTAFDIMAL